MTDEARDTRAWLSDLTTDQRRQAEEIAAVVRAVHYPITVAIKWDRLTFTVEGNWHHWLCAIAVTKRGVSLLFHKGSLLDDPAELLQGESRYLRRIPYEQVVAHRGAVTDLVLTAAAQQTDMLEDGR